MLAFKIRQLFKMAAQNIYLPFCYRLFCLRPIKKGQIVFADAHHDQIPFSMQEIHAKLIENGCDVIDCFCDYGRRPFLSVLKKMTAFMKLYAQTEYVFICDYFLPISSCKQREGTKLIQLWHSGGLMKKYAYDAPEDIPPYYKGNMFGNYTFLTLSSENVIPVHEKALRLPKERFLVSGLARTDVYFKQSYNAACRERFYRMYPEAKGKKIILWAPTFRGNAADPYVIGTEAVKKLAAGHKDWYVVIKMHPHIDAKEQTSNCALPTEQTLPVTDLMITDYSSVFFDYLVYRRPAVFFAPDLQQYEAGRGFYIDYRTLPGPVVTDGDRLAQAVEAELENPHSGELDAWYAWHMGACDGHSAERILKAVGLDGR